MCGTHVCMSYVYFMYTPVPVEHVYTMDIH
jgi:hypothetical protein